MGTEIRKLENGDHVVDLGRKWFRVSVTGSVTASETYMPNGEIFGRVRKRPATATEAKLARLAVRRAAKASS